MSQSVRVGRLLRQNKTWAEKLMWTWLRDRRFAVYKFRRQTRVKGLYLDFYCVQARLNIELDGSGHGFPEQQRIDAERDSVLEAEGIMVLRFWNHQLRSEPELVRERIWTALQERVPRHIPVYWNLKKAKKG